VEMMDERLTSWEARQALSATNPAPRRRNRSPRTAGSKRKTPLDEIAAAIILQDYLDQSHERAGSQV